MRGFTLIELMIVIAIMAILVVIAVPSYNEYNNNQKLAEAANQLQTILRQAQNNAQTGTLCNPDTASASKANYWYVQFTTDTTNNNNSQYILGPDCESGSQVFSPTLLPSGVTISNISIGGCPTLNTETIKAKFSNVSSNLIFEGSAGCPDNTNFNLEITLSLNNSATNIRIVKVEKGGSIYVTS